MLQVFACDGGARQSPSHKFAGWAKSAVDQGVLSSLSRFSVQVGSLASATTRQSTVVLTVISLRSIGARGEEQDRQWSKRGTKENSEHASIQKEQLGHWITRDSLRLFTRCKEAIMNWRPPTSSRCHTCLHREFATILGVVCILERYYSYTATEYIPPLSAQ